MLDNSAKYSERGGTVAVSVECDSREVTIRIVDQGIGISAEFLPRAFELFVQAEQARAHAGHGMGIGLSLVKRIVELHQGTVQAYSTGPGLGSTFTVRLPRTV